MWLLAAMGSSGCRSLDEFSFEAADLSDDGVTSGDGAQADAATADAATADADTADADGVSPGADGAGDGGADGQASGACTSAADCGQAADPCAQFACTGGKCQLEARPNGAACEDGYDCTVGGSCLDGVCGQFASNSCKCLTDSGCSAPANKCFTKAWCDTSVPGHLCRPNPASEVTCDATLDPACATTACEPTTGACVMKLTAPPAGAKFAPCDDGNPCTGVDYCLKGQCIFEKSECGCTQASDCLKFAANKCKGELYCDVLANSPTCKVNPITVPTCEEDDNPCTAVGCDPGSGACVTKPMPPNSSCSDGDPCTSDLCVAGVCQPGVHMCSCTADADCAKFASANPCDGSYYCDKSAPGAFVCKVNPATVIACAKADDNFCRTNQCNPTTGACAFVYAAKWKPCDADGDPCTALDSCDHNGICVAGPNVCTCAKDGSCPDNGNPCDGTMLCNTTAQPPVCEVNPATVVHCTVADGNPCLQSACDPKSGKCQVTAKSNETPCDADGLACTKGDTCTDGACTAGSNICACTKDAACIDDGNPCNGVPFCDKFGDASCKPNPATVVSCSGAKTGTCLASACNPATGACAPLPISGACDDGNDCTVDVCGPAGACQHGPVVDGAVCGAGRCVGGACQAVPAGMVLVPGGVGYAGCASADAVCAAAEGVLTKVTLAATWVDAREVTVDDYSACVAGGNCQPLALAEMATACNATVVGRQKHPLDCVAAGVAQTYCSAQGKRLPTEAEWERAARGGCDVHGASNLCASKTPTFPWQLDVASCDFAVMDDGGGPGCGAGMTRAAGIWVKDDSPYGIKDMGGNVREWTGDAWTQGPWDGTAKDSPAPKGGTDRVIKGGSYLTGPLGVRSSARAKQDVKVGAIGLGFRCVREVAAKSGL